MINVAYLALGGRASSKMSRSKMPMGQILAAAENLALDKAAQQVSAKKNLGPFLFYAEKLAFAKAEGCHAIQTFRGR